MRVNFTMDGGEPQMYIHDGSCFNIACYNVSVYDVHLLTYENHNLDIALLSYEEDSTFTYRTEFDFDYAVVDDTRSSAPTLPASSSVTGASSSVPSASSSLPNAPSSLASPGTAKGHFSQYVLYIEFSYVDS